MDPLLELFRNPRERDLVREGIVLAEGLFLTERLLDSGWPLLGILCAERMRERVTALAAGRVVPRVLPEAELRAIAGFQFHRGVLAAARRPVLPSVAQLLQARGGPSFLAVCPSIADPQNLGSIIRSAAAFGLDGLLAGGRGCDPLSRRALRVSMGGVFRLPLALMDDEEAAVRALREHGFRLVGTAPTRAAVPLERFRRPSRLALVLGAEGPGLDEDWIRRCDEQVRIPLAAGTDSLNVGVAAGVLFHALAGPAPRFA